MTLDVNLAQITVGLAWHYKKYAKDQTGEDRERYAFAEDEASVSGGINSHINGEHHTDS
jgi:hypothetical protein